MSKSFQEQSLMSFFCLILDDDKCNIIVLIEEKEF